VEGPLVLDCSTGHLSQRKGNGGGRKKARPMMRIGIWLELLGFGLISFVELDFAAEFSSGKELGGKLKAEQTLGADSLIFDGSLRSFGGQKSLSTKSLRELSVACLLSCFGESENGNGNGNRRRKCFSFGKNVQQLNSVLFLALEEKQQLLRAELSMILVEAEKATVFFCDQQKATWIDTKHWLRVGQ